MQSLKYAKFRISPAFYFTHHLFAAYLLTYLLTSISATLNSQLYHAIDRLPIVQHKQSSSVKYRQFS